MSLYNYLVKSNGPYEEIRCDFHQEEFEQLYKVLRKIGYEKYCTFVREYLSDIQQYIGLSPSQRRQKKWVNHPYSLLIRLAAYQISYATVQLLEDIRPIDDLVDSGSYRKFHSIIADALSRQIVSLQLTLFPKSYPNPFEEDSPDELK